ncbi:MAG: hypothetical protein Q4D06_07240 [Coriobacteriia bacterium]|nr:hypothetical protein [Coriobacteriia bacterium]
MPEQSHDPIFLTGLSAVSYWLSPRPKSLDSEFERAIIEQGQNPRSPIPYLGEPMELPSPTVVPKGLSTRLTRNEALSIRSTIGGWLPVSILADTGQSGISTHFYARAVLPAAAPRRSYIRISHRIYVPSPELTLVQAAPLLDLVDLTVLCSLFFSVFCFRPDSIRTVPRRALCTPESARDFIREQANRNWNPPGIKQLRKAAALAVSQTASPAELNCGLRMEFPLRLDGYGLGRARHNATVSTGAGPDDVRWCDWLWKPSRRPAVAAEYQSDEDHAGERARKRDLRRDNELAAAGLTTFSLLSEHLMSAAAMDTVAAQLGSALGRRPFPDDEDSKAARERLRRRIATALNRFHGLVG